MGKNSITDGFIEGGLYMWVLIDLLVGGIKKLINGTKKLFNMGRK